MGRFRYPLDAILKQYDWEIDALKTELMTLNQALNAKHAELQTVLHAVQDAERQILDMCRQDAIIALDRKSLVETYLRDRRLRMQTQQQEIDQTQALADSVFQQLSRKRQAQRAIEKHRERKKNEFDADGVRRDALEADELWLTKLGAVR